MADEEEDELASSSSNEEDHDDARASGNANSAGNNVNNANFGTNHAHYDANNAHFGSNNAHYGSNSSNHGSNNSHYGANYESTGMDQKVASSQCDSSSTSGVALESSSSRAPNSDEDEIDDAALLRSMLIASEEHYNALEEEEKQCWVCFATEQDDPTALWSHPCKCRGTTKWVHQACIQRWVDEKQKGNAGAQVRCPQCGFAYRIKFPRGNLLVTALDATEKLIQRLCPIVAGGFLAGSLYWTCVTYGAVTLMQVMGHDKGVLFIRRSDPLLLLVALPLVPVSLFIGKMVRWEDKVLTTLRTVVPRLPLSRYVLPSFAMPPERNSLQSSLPPISDPISVTRVFCGALFFPTVATFVGSTLFEKETSQLRRTIYGGVTFVVLKGMLRIYHKQHLFLRQGQREILDHNEPSPSSWR